MPRRSFLIWTIRPEASVTSVDAAKQTPLLLRYLLMLTEANRLDE
jgi:hypothetical protein